MKKGLELLVLGIILGSGLAFTNYCDEEGVYCTRCKDVFPNRSCEGCGNGMKAIEVEKDTFACREKAAPNCQISGNSCSYCDEGFSFNYDGKPECLPFDELRIKDCFKLMTSFKKTFCQICGNGKIPSEDKMACNRENTDPNCEYGLSSSCVQCKPGWALESRLTFKCSIPVSGDLIGCQSLNSSGDSCTDCKILPGKNGEQYWMNKIGQCNLKALPELPIIKKIKKLFPKYNAEQLKNLRLVYDKAKLSGFNLDSQIAYLISTAIVEFNAIPEKEKRAPEGSEKRKEQDQYWFTGFYGRGYAQLTWDYNYKYFAAEMKTDLYNNPDLALDPEISAKILAYGAKNGSFTGKKLEAFINSDKKDFLEARRVLDNTAKNAQAYATLAQQILDA